MTEHTRPRIYGTGHDDPEAHAKRPGHDYVELTGGPLDGQLLDVIGLTANEGTAGAYLITPAGAPHTDRPSAAPSAPGSAKAACPERHPQAADRQNGAA
ncbi:hypothetical protein [Streptomyces sp. NPDC091416]|uniref:hypothetical protein n=1 Tax=Streptomyces sp. NPDC091416 TaxID=3366003 RepID=UPI003823946F